MHTLITDAAPLGPRCQSALATLRLPQLQALLRLLPPGQTIAANPDSLTPLAEKLYAAALGLPHTDGLIPWAALDARQRAPGSAPPEAGTTLAGWAWITPCHWQIHSDHVAMHAPASLQLTAAESEALRNAMAPYFAEDGIALYPSDDGTWLAHGAVLHQLPTAALARVSGDVVDRWLPRQAEARVLRRLQNEMQMLLYTHPVNEARSARGLAEVNSFWISGTGPLPDTPLQPDVQRFDALHQANRDDDASAWTAAWQQLEHTAITPLLQLAQRGEAVRLTLCGTQAALEYTGPVLTGRARWTARWRQWMHPDTPQSLLQSL